MQYQHGVVAFVASGRLEGDLGMGGIQPQSMGSDCWELWIHYVSIVWLNSVATHALQATRRSAVEKQLGMYCILLFKLIQWTAIVSSGHRWLRQCISLSTARRVGHTKARRVPAKDPAFQRSNVFRVTVTCRCIVYEL